MILSIYFTGLTILDEPAAEQSDSALLHLQLRAISKTTSAKSTVVSLFVLNRCLSLPRRGVQFRGSTRIVLNSDGE